MTADDVDPQKYGLRGILPTLSVASDGTLLAIGTDMTCLGVDVNSSSRYLYDTFGGPFTSNVFEKKGRLVGDDRYESKVYRAEHSTRDKPNLVPAYYDDKIIACLCEPDAQLHFDFAMIRKGTPRRCQCGHWFKVVETGPDLF